MLQEIKTDQCPRLQWETLFVFLIFVLVGAARGEACSAVASGERQGLLGANYDWRARGGIVFESPRGQIKTAISPNTDQETMIWTSRLASLTISQFGRDFPMQGMNEAGLSGLVLMSQAAYPQSGALGVVTENLWLQYQLDQYETVSEVVAHVADLGIEKLSATLHWFFCDRSSACASIDFIDGAASIHTGSSLDLRALTNSPYAAARLGYDEWALRQTQAPRGYDSIARFIRLAAISGQSGFGDERSSMTAALDQVSRAGFTAWQTVFDLAKRQFHIKLHTAASAKQHWQTFNVASGIGACGPGLRMLVLGRDQSWKPYEHAEVASMFADAAHGAEGLGAVVREKVLRQSESVNCQP